MEKTNNTEGAIFKQICAVNEVNPQVVEREAQEKCADKLQENNKEEVLIWAALDLKARTLISSILTEPIPGTHKLYTIDGDPAAPSFVINEDAIHELYKKTEADQIIAVLGQVKMPIRA